MDIEELAKKSRLLDRALLGVMTMSRDSIPAGSWEEELLPLYELSIEISVGLRVQQAGGGVMGAVRPLHPGPLTLADVTIKGPGGEEISGKDLAGLVRLAAEHPSAYSVYSAGDVNMRLRGLGILCGKASHNTDIFHGEEHVLWFIGSTLTDLAALLEAGDSPPKPSEYAVTTAEQTDGA